MSSELIDQYVDRGKFASDTEFIESELKRVVELFDKVNKTKITLQGSSTLKGVAAASEEGIKANARLNESTKAVISLVNQRFATEAKLVTLQTDYAKATAANRVEIGKQNAEMKTQAQLQAANTGSLERARAAVKSLRQEQEGLNLFTKEGQDRNAQLISQIDKYNVFIKKNSDALAQQKINVGNYSGAVSFLKTSLDEVIKKMDQQSKAGKSNSDVMKALEKEYKILNQLVNSQEAGFASAAAEIKENQKALLQMTQAGLQGTEAFNKLALATGQLKDDIADLKARTKQLGSDTFVFDGLIQGAQSLAGVYGVAQGASALFGEENEDLQKTLLKLAAVMTIIQSLQAVANSLQKESAAMLLLQTVREKALLGIQTLKNFVLRGSVSATAAATAATTANTTATAATTVATTAATVATRAFRAALIATGIGALLVLLASAASAMSNFKDKNKEATLSVEDFTAAIEKETAAVDDSISAIDRKVERQKLLNRLKFSGENLKEADNITEVNGLIEQQGLKYSSLNERIKERNRLQDLLNKLNAQSSAINIADPIQGFIDKKRNEEFADKIREGINVLNKQIIEDGKSSIKLSEDVSNKLVSIKGDEMQEKFKKEEEARKKAADRAKKDIEDAAKRAAEYAKKEAAAQIEILRLAIEDRKNIAQSIIDDEKKSYDERLAALTEFSQASKELIDFENNLVQKDKTKTPKEKQLAEDKAVIATRNLKLASEKTYNDLVSKYFEERRAKADREFEEYKARSEKQKQIAKDLLETGTNKEELELRAKFEQESIGASAEKRKQLEEKLTEDIIKLREKAALVQLILDNNELQRKRALLNLFKQSTAEIDKLITLNELEQSKIRIGNTQKEVDEKEKIRNKAIDTAVLIEEQATDLISTLLNAKNTREKNRIQDEIDGIEEKKNREIEAVQASLLSEQEKAARITVINATAQAKKEQLEQRQRKLDLERAKFEKAMGILQIIVQIGVAIAKQQYIAAALGAVALAKAIATPLPRFMHGKGPGNKYEGLGITNDGGKLEPIFRASTGQIELPSTVNNVTYLGKDDIVYSSIEDMMRKTAFKPVPKITTDNDGSQLIRSELRKHSFLLGKIADKKELSLGTSERGMVALWKHGSNTVKYFNEQTNWNT